MGTTSVLIFCLLLSVKDFWCLIQFSHSNLKCFLLTFLVAFGEFIVLLCLCLHSCRNQNNGRKSLFSKRSFFNMVVYIKKWKMKGSNLYHNDIWLLDKSSLLPGKCDFNFLFYFLGWLVCFFPGEPDEGGGYSTILDSGKFYCVFRTLQLWISKLQWCQHPTVPSLVKLHKKWQIITGFSYY